MRISSLRYDNSRRRFSEVQENVTINFVVTNQASYQDYTGIKNRVS